MPRQEVDQDRDQDETPYSSSSRRKSTSKRRSQWLHCRVTSWLRRAVEHTFEVHRWCRHKRSFCCRTGSGRRHWLCLQQPRLPACMSMPKLIPNLPKTALYHCRWYRRGSPSFTVMSVCLLNPLPTQPLPTCREELDGSSTILRYIARTATKEQFLYGRDALAAVQVSKQSPLPV